MWKTKGVNERTGRLGTAFGVNTEFLLQYFMRKQYQWMRITGYNDAC